ncbi:MAG: DUF2255 family protein [Gemmatimonadetes bacterium]|nr:DUF2255 family protein [Gemmatimonadota bacterium]
MTAPRFTARDIEALDAAKILGVRSGTEHPYTAVWPVVVEGRVFARSWSDQPTGWYRAFLDEPRGSIQVGKREIRVLARRPRSERLIRAVTDAIAPNASSGCQGTPSFRTSRTSSGAPTLLATS